MSPLLSSVASYWFLLLDAYVLNEHVIQQYSWYVVVFYVVVGMVLQIPVC